MKRTLALLATLAVAFSASAQDGTLKKIKDTGAITVGHRDASIPFSYYDDKQQVIGYSMDICAVIVEAVKKNLNMRARGRTEPACSWPRMGGTISTASCASPERSAIATSAVAL